MPKLVKSPKVVLERKIYYLSIGVGITHCKSQDYSFLLRGGIWGSQSKEKQKKNKNHRDLRKRK
jgi:hypothetical protein